MLRKCKKCGTEFESRPDASLSCAEESIRSVIRPRVCQICGVTFPGYPGSKYCPECAEERKKIRYREYHARRRRGVTRKIGSTDVCAVCGAEYIVASGLQKYCPECAPVIMRENDRKKSREWNAANIDYDQQRQERQDAAASVSCPICGKLYRPRIGGTLTCSEECATELRRRKERIYRDTHREQINARRRQLRAERKQAKDAPDETVD